MNNISRTTFKPHQCGALICPYHKRTFPCDLEGSDLCSNPRNVGQYTCFVRMNHGKQEELNITAEEYQELVKNNPDIWRTTKFCPFYLEWKEQNEKFNDYKKAGIVDNETETYTDTTFDDYVGDKSLKSVDCLRMIAEEPNTFIGHSIYVWGPNATQKSAQCKALAKSLRDNKVSCLYTTMDEVVQTCYNYENASNNPFLEKDDYLLLKKKHDDMLNAIFLFIDESFDLTKFRMYKTGTNLPALTSFLEKRIKNNARCNIFISNQDPNSLDVRVFGESIKNWIKDETMGAQLYFEDNVFDSRNKQATMDIFTKVKEDRNTWLITDPDGKTYKTLNLAEFCRKHFDSEANSYQANLKGRGKHKGWTATKGV